MKNGIGFMLAGAGVAMLGVGLVVSGDHRRILTPEIEPIRLELTGTKGLPVTGTLVVDGVACPFAGRLPTDIYVPARTFRYEIRLADGTGELHGELFVAGGSAGCSATSGSGVGIKGGLGRRGTLVTERWSYFATLPGPTPGGGVIH